MKEWASFPLRIALGLVFMAHGLQKAFGLFGGPGLSAFGKYLASMGFNPGIRWAYIVACIELAGGLCVLTGFGSRIASVLLAAVMVVAMVKVHLVKGLFLSAGGFEYTLILIAALISLIILGPGKASINKK